MSDPSLDSDSANSESMTNSAEFLHVSCSVQTVVLSELPEQQIPSITQFGNTPHVHIQESQIPKTSQSPVEATVTFDKLDHDMFYELGRHMAISHLPALLQVNNSLRTAIQSAEFIPDLLLEKLQDEPDITKALEKYVYGQGSTPSAAHVLSYCYARCTDMMVRLTRADLRNNSAVYQRIVNLFQTLGHKRPYDVSTPLLCALLQNGVGDPCTHEPERCSLLVELLSSGADPDVRDSMDMTPLTHAVRRECVRCCKALLETDLANPLARTSLALGSKCALDYAFDFAYSCGSLLKRQEMRAMLRNARMQCQGRSKRSRDETVDAEAAHENKHHKQ